jgi:hypothetical protein
MIVILYTLCITRNAISEIQEMTHYYRKRYVRGERERLQIILNLTYEKIEINMRLREITAIFVIKLVFGFFIKLNFSKTDLHG